METKQDKLIAIISDLHINSTIGLSKSRLILDDGGTYSASNPQMWLLEQWQAYWEKVRELQEETSAKLIVVLNGDIVDHNKHSKYQLISDNRAVILQHAFSILNEVLLKDDKLYVIRGTEAHTGESSELEEQLAMSLGAQKVDGSNYSVRALDLRAGKYLFDITHHGSVGRRPWTVTNSSMALATEVLVERVRLNQPIPDFVIRSHNHIHTDTYDMHPVRVIQTPAFELANNFVYRIGVSRLSDIGGLIFHIKADGTYELHKHIAQLINRPYATA